MKFFNLLKKELSELLTFQTIFSAVIVMALFMILGNVMSDAFDKVIDQEYNISISDRDKTELTESFITLLEENGAKLTVYETEGDDYAAILKDNDAEAMVIIPEGFTEKLLSGEKPEVISISAMGSAATLANLTNDTTGTVNLLCKCVSSVLASSEGVTDEAYALITDPLTVANHTIVGSKSAAVSNTLIMSKLSMQSMLIPIIVFVLIIMTSQMLMNAISSEKIDKTLETLLSAPVSRMSILSAKMIAAALVAMLNAVCYMVGMSSMLKSTTSEMASAVTTTSSIPINEAMEQLGLTLGAGDYVLIGIQLFMTIMICLSVSLMLGALINDPKQSQTFLLPLMFMAMIPYLISMIADINTLPTVVKLLVYAIPFTHTFSAMSNLSFGHMGIFFGGMAYQLVVFVICLVCALKLFKSDLILTANLNFGQKSKFKKRSKKSEE